MHFFYKQLKNKKARGNPANIKQLAKESFSLRKYSAFTFFYNGCSAFILLKEIYLRKYKRENPGISWKPWDFNTEVFRV